uniref:Uncharacterized protein n=1 Tax=Rhizophora mucronata TaxID=61149 RepID=A0A2P2IND7_RHIMU
MQQVLLGTAAIRVRNTWNNLQY